MLGSLIAIVGGSVLLSGALLCVAKMRLGLSCVLIGLVMLGTGLVFWRSTGEIGCAGGYRARWGGASSRYAADIRSKIFPPAFRAFRAALTSGFMELA